MLLTAVRKEKQELINQGEIIGIQKGKIQGKTEALSEIVLSMNDNGINLDNISKITKLSILEIQSILKAKDK